MFYSAHLRDNSGHHVVRGDADNWLVSKWDASCSAHSLAQCQSLVPINLNFEVIQMSP